MDRNTKSILTSPTIERAIAAHRKYHDAADLDAALNYTIEECAELIVAIRHLARGRVSDSAVLEELADVMFMCRISLDMFGESHKDFMKIVDAKAARSIQRNTCAR